MTVSMAWTTPFVAVMSVSITLAAVLFPPECETTLTTPFLNTCVAIISPPTVVGVAHITPLAKAVPKNKYFEDVVYIILKLSKKRNFYPPGRACLRMTALRASLSARRLFKASLGTLAKASLVGANTVKESACLIVSTRPAA